ncbi:MAG: GNAT family N-acetyltransferase [Flavobacteriaceae bacterium CG_4_9_14_0_8_um_filter_34_30]|nr:GNAT family N-acetyltransferase [Bacteroidota bacterium]PJC07728.1 MAG: GNAT family N-acetyltransferase [Flavobacteriaceae bacterium CG_4_9_14_0_8_um_filter_34_30]
MKPKITYRKITNKDIDLLFEWSNDELTRENSFNTNRIDYVEHQEWFLKKINNKNALYLISEVNNIPAALIRFDMEKDFALMGINLDKKFRGKGLSFIFLNDCCILFFEKYKLPIKAYIKDNNFASINIFLKAGFILEETIVYKNQKTHVYEKTAKI